MAYLSEILISKRICFLSLSSIGHPPDFVGIGCINQCSLLRGKDDLAGGDDLTGETSPSSFIDGKIFLPIALQQHTVCNSHWEGGGGGR